MNKLDIVKTVSKKTGFSQKDVSEVSDCIFNTLADGLVDGNDINIANFGKFVLQTRSAREGINPKTLSKIQIPESRVVKFKPSVNLKTAVK